SGQGPIKPPNLESVGTGSALRAYVGGRLQSSRRSLPATGQEPLDPDIGGAVATGIAHLVGTCGTIGLLREVDEEALVERHAAVHGVAVDLEKRGASPRHVGVELVVPRAQERVRHIEPLAVQAELQHLWPALQLVSLHLTPLAQESTEPELSGQLRM